MGQPHIKMGSVSQLVFLFFAFFADFATCAAIGPYYITVSFFWHGDGGQLGWFVFITIRNTKPWMTLLHVHHCSVD